MILWAGSVLLLIAALALLAACGSSTSTSSSTTPTASATGSPSTAAAWTPADLAAITADPSLKSMLPATIQSAGQIRVASDIPYPPWEMYVSPTSKQPTGFDYDLSQALGKKIGIPVSFNEQPFSGIILSVKAGKNDMIMSDMYDNAVREKVVSFVDYAFDGTSILVLKGNPQGITNLDSLAGKNVACETGTTQQVFLQDLNKKFASEGKPQMSIQTLPDQPSALLAIKSGKVVGDLTDHSTAEYIAKTTNNGNTFEVVADPTAPNGYQPQVVGIGIIKTSGALVNTVQKALQDLIDEGTYTKIISSYGLLPVKSAMVNQGPALSSPAP